MLALSACGASQPMRRPPEDPLLSAPHEGLFAKGVAFARRGDLTRAEQYLSAALLRGHARRPTVIALVRVCVAASRMRVAAHHAESYLREVPDDASMHYIAGTVYVALDQDRAARDHLLAAIGSPRPVSEAAVVLAEITDSPDRRRELLALYLQRQPEGRLAARAQRELALLAEESR
jgi:hypothetical protein